MSYGAPEEISADASTEMVDPESFLLGLVKACVIPQALYVLVRLGVFDALAGGPTSSTALARRLGADAQSLSRVLRLACGADVLREPSPGRFALGPLGPCLVTGAPGSMRAQVLAMCEEPYQAATGLLDAVREGGTPFERIYGASHRGYVANRPDAASTWEDAERSAAHHARKTAVDHYGTDRLSCGSIGQDPPAGGELYLIEDLSSGEDRVLGARLAEIRAAIRPGVRLLLVERLISRGPGGGPARIDDLVLLTVSGGRVRTEAEIVELLAGAGFVLRCVIPTPSGLHLLEAVPG